MRKPNAEVAAKIRAAVTELLKTKEPSQIGMRDIASLCGITAANIYHYYRNKDELLNEISLSMDGGRTAGVFAENLDQKNSVADTENKKRNGMKEVSALINYRPSIKVVDATLRDGGLVNDFFFPEGFAKALYEANDDYIRTVVGDNNTDRKIAVMADVGRTDFKTDIRPKNESPVDLIRVATYLHQIPGAIEMIEDAHNKGYETSCNIMAISTAQDADIRSALDIIGQSPVDVIYIVDSYGSIYPEAMARIADVYGEFSAKYNKKLGIHAHNNQQLAFANTIEAVGDGVDYLDATYGEMGRGAGNCAIELLIGFLKNPKYNIYPVLDFLEKHVKPMKESGVKWGYDIQYLLTGLFNQHPRTAIAFTKDGRKDYTEYFKELTSQE